MITGNKGEWSEIYALFKLLSEQKLYVGAPDLNRIEDLYYPIIKILRAEGNNNFEYICGSNITIIDGVSNAVLLDIPVSTFAETSVALFKQIKEAKGSSFSCSDIENFMTQIQCKTLKAKSQDKTDIKIVVHDLKTNMEQSLGFSIKSKLGKPSTLFNAGKTTNFIYEVTGKDFSSETIVELNNKDLYPTIKDTLMAIIKVGGTFVFKGIERPHLYSNLMMIDSELPKIMSEMVLNYYTSSHNKTIDLLEDIKEQNPCDFPVEEGQPFYEYKVKNFLTDVALGMMPSKIWDGKYEATGGYLVIKKDGDIICYHIYNRNEFQSYLISNTKFETADLKRHDFGTIYQNDGKTYIKLNLQIRFL